MIDMIDRLTIEDALSAAEAANFIICGAHTCLHGVTSVVMKPSHDRPYQGPRVGPFIPGTARVDIYAGTYTLRVWDAGWKVFSSERSLDHIADYGETPEKTDSRASVSGKETFLERLNTLRESVS